ncbi:hypothetical protein CYLTODRAFT_452013 [Cylindrobasidium torrendii FP15055 ss-10]|uniref:Uncharacterized protein n=1 Tax=Cylindrobasidium torrendii FP15055 ss-10 TaxID=1314674 RepID=A0A0D7BHQ7_9AGAR|nr:hypothetical protein CYLTODRAFT_452013 [Cylindrobasidium torrendii FP15055 ss-10]
MDVPDPATFLRAEDISFSDEFSDVVEFSFLPGRDDMVPWVEYSGGLPPKSLWDDSICGENTINIQSDMYNFLDMGALSFVPSDETLLKILETAEHNRKCSLDDRITLGDDIPEFNTELCEYTLVVAKAIRETIFTRDPYTGIVQEHTWPYPNIPRFKLSANPWMVSTHAYGAAFYQGIHSPLVRRVGASIESGTLPTAFKPVFKPASFRRNNCPTSLGSDVALSAPGSGDSGSGDEYEYEFCGLAVNEWITTLPAPDAFSDVNADEQDVAQLHTLEPLPEPKIQLSEDDTNWRSVAIRRRLLDPSSIVENSECLSDTLPTPTGSDTPGMPASQNSILQDEGSDTQRAYQTSESCEDMPQLLRAEDISFSAEFSGVTEFTFLPGYDDMVPWVEYSGGLPPKSLWGDPICGENTITIQSNIHILLDMGALSFIPSDESLFKILETAEHNRKCPLDDRITLGDDIPEFNTKLCEYTLKIARGVTKTIFTRDPYTGIVQEHTSPYPDIPRFKLTANPWMVSTHAYRTAFSHGDHSPLVRRVGASIESGTLPTVFKPVFKPASFRRNNVPTLTCGTSGSDVASIASDSGGSGSGDEYEFCGLAVKDWITTLPAPDAFSDADADEQDVTQLHALEPLPEPKTHLSKDDTNWRSVAIRLQLLDPSSIAENSECLPEPYTHTLPMPSGSQTPEIFASRDSILLASQGEGSDIRRSCPSRRAKTVAAAALNDQLCTKSRLPRSIQSSKRKRGPAPTTDDFASLDNDSAPKGKRKCHIQRETRSLPSRVAKSVAADRMTKQLWGRSKPTPSRRG